MGDTNEQVNDLRRPRRRDVLGSDLRRERSAADQDRRDLQRPTLTEAKGMSLYTFDKDSGGKSACNGPCATNWPVLKAEASDKASDSYTIITRDDGSKQWAYKGKPLYTFAKDQKAGDITGDGFLNGAWHLAQP